MCNVQQIQVGKLKKNPINVLIPRAYKRVLMSYLFPFTNGLH